MNPTFWKEKKVLITGHTGFKGAWLSLWLQSVQAKVVGFSLEPPTTPNLYDVAGVEKGMKTIFGDVRDYESLKSALECHQPEIVFHLAAQSLVRQSYEFPVETYATNVMGTVNLFEAVRHIPSVRMVVNVTSDKCYENIGSSMGYSEMDRLGGHDPYSNSKACAELVTTAFRQSYHIGIASVRAGNVIGGGDWAKDRIVPDTIRALLENEELRIRYPEAIRPWQHVLDPLSGYLVLAEQMYIQSEQFLEAWNFGPTDQENKSVAWLVDKIYQLWGMASSWKQDEVFNPHEATILKLDSTKAREKLGWAPRWSLEQALESTVDWFKAYEKGDSMREKTLQQINQYMIAN